MPDREHHPPRLPERQSRKQTGGEGKTCEREGCCERRDEQRRERSLATCLARRGEIGCRPRRNRRQRVPWRCSGRSGGGRVAFARAAGARAHHRGRVKRSRRRRGRRSGTVPGYVPGVPGGRATRLRGAAMPAEAGAAWTRRGAVLGSCASPEAGAGTPAAASAGATASLARPDSAGAAGGAVGGAAGAELVAVAAGASWAAASACSTAGCTAAVVPGATASTCAKAELTAVVTSATPGGEPAARASPGAASAPQAAPASTQMRSEKGLVARFRSEIVQSLVIARPAPEPSARRSSRRPAGRRARPPGAPR